MSIFTTAEDIVLSLAAGIPADKLQVRRDLLTEINRCPLCKQDDYGVCWAKHRSQVKNAGLKLTEVFA